MTWGAVAGAAVGAVGSYVGAKSQPKPAKFRPWSTGNLWGDVAVTGKRELTQNLSPYAQGVVDQVQDIGQIPLSGGRELAGLGSEMQNYAAGQMMPAFQGVNEIGLPYGAYGAAMGGIGGVAGGLNNLFQTAMFNPYAQQQMALGQQLLGAAPQSYQDVAASRLALLREQAAPFEERAQNSLTQKLFSMGQLGPNSTAGNRNIEAFSRGLAQADTARQLDAQNLAEGLYGRDLSAALQQQGYGANLFAGGVGNYLAGLGQAGSLGGQALGAYGSLADLGFGMNQLAYSRAGDRLSRTSQLFGFGQAAQTAPAQALAPYLNILSGISGEQAGLVNQSTQLAGGQVAAGPQGGSATGQALGGFLGGLGTGMGNMDLRGLFSRDSGGGGTPVGGVIGYGSDASGAGGNIFGNLADGWGLGG